MSRKRHRPFLLVGSAKDLKLLHGIARSALAASPGSEQALTPILDRFIRSTQSARKRLERDHERDAARQDARQETRGVDGRTVLGYTVLTVVVVASLVAGCAVLPPKGTFEVERSLTMTVSLVGAGVAAVMSLLGALIPGWGSPETRKQAWQLHLAGAVMVVVGLVVSLLRTAEDRSEIGAGLWQAWLFTNVLAVAALCIGAVARARRTLPSSRMSGPPPDPDAEYFAAIEPRKRYAASELDALVAKQDTTVSEVDRRWRDGIAAARASGSLSARAAESARAMSAFSWELEATAEPDFVPSRPHDG
ncbi:hypothetical protein [Glaciibacter superstes]|uniref:hypothetical protein n=1 Tax=Glaciibacter superstes TaxID=501023 RepID=UPI0003B54313|nr:hypothetical protein [Glaciibacter superstes]